MARGAKPEVEERAARIIQRRFRKYVGCKQVKATGSSNHFALKQNLVLHSLGDLTEEEKDFLRPWCKRWRIKSIFQVLLLYRAERLQTLANFCLQIHLYNQNSLISIRRTQGGIDMEEINMEAEPAEYLPPWKPIIPKLPLTWANLSSGGSVTDCEPLPKCDIERLESEIHARKSQEESTKNFEDKEIQTLFSQEDNHLQNEEVTSYLTVITNKQRPNDNYYESPSEPKSEIFNRGLIEETEPNIATDARLPARNDVTEENSTIRRGKGYTLPSSIKSTRNNLKGNLDRGFSTSLNEMEEKFRNKDYKANRDDPPFNFRAVLKKTNPSAQSRKTLVDEEFDFLTEIRNFSFSERKLLVRRGEFGKLRRTSETIKTEIAPGIIICGKVTDL